MKTVPALLVAALLASAVAFNFLPVTFTLSENAQDDALKPFGEILPANPLTHCASDIGVYGKYREVTLALLLANYNRLNTGHYVLQSFVLNGGDKVILHEEVFSAADVRDNKYKSFVFAPMSTIPGTLCFSLLTGDSTPGNAITVWLNGNGDPVTKITAVAPLPELLTRLGSRHIFGLGREALFGLFFVYLAVQIWLIIYLAGKAYELEKIPKPAHSKRTGKSRV